VVLGRESEDQEDRCGSVPTSPTWPAFPTHRPTDRVSAMPSGRCSPPRQRPAWRVRGSTVGQRYFFRCFFFVFLFIVIVVVLLIDFVLARVRVSEPSLWSRRVGLRRLS
jgi:hypothetical protein